LSCVRAGRSGNITDEAGSPVSVSDFKHLVYINADELVYQNAYLSGGGAHSDIYRKEHGALIWRLISAGND